MLRNYILFVLWIFIFWISTSGSIQNVKNDNDHSIKISFAVENCASTSFDNPEFLEEENDDEDSSRHLCKLLAVESVNYKSCIFSNEIHPARSFFTVCQIFHFTPFLYNLPPPAIG